MSTPLRKKYFFDKMSLLRKINSMKFIIDNEEYIDLEDVIEMTGIKQTLLYEKMRYNSFPKPEKKQLPTTVTFVKKRSLWKKSEINEYLESTRKLGESNE